MKAIAYLRVSTKSQGDSGLGIEAQREYIAQAAKAKGWEIVAEFTDTASGTIAPIARPECAKAIKAAREAGAVLVVAKLDRLSRSVAHISALMEETPFRVATMPDADTFQLHIYAALAQQEREFIAGRTRDALASLKARAEAGDKEAKAKIKRRDAGRAAAHRKGTKAGVAGAVSAADAYAKTVGDNIKAARFDGVTTLLGCADYLNRRGIKTRRGSQFTATTVKRIADRLGITFP